MATKKKAAGEKARSETIIDALEIGRKMRAPDEVSHSPIIITDGSASVEFDGREYVHNGSGKHYSFGLLLDRVDARRVHGGPVIHVCKRFTGNTLHRITAHCMLNGVPTEITIEGAKETPVLSFTPSVDFRRGSHFVESGAFPPTTQFGRRFSNANVRITSFTITDLSSGEVHNCPLVAEARGVHFTIIDDHA